MKKLQLLSILTLLFISSAFGQIDTKELESENQKLKAEIVIKKETISNLEEEVNYLKETLDLIVTNKPVVRSNVEFRISSLTGKSDQGEVTVKGIVENKGAFIQHYTFTTRELVDPKGNKYSAKNVEFSGELHTDLHKNVPVSFEMTFKGIVDEVSIMKAISWKTSGQNRDMILFKNLPVIWN